jgi:hypothetical protein
MVGSFNPAIVHPSWLAEHEILPPSDLAFDTPEGESDVDLRLVTPDFAQFRIGWLTVQVTREHFDLTTPEADRVPLLRDAAVNIFSLLSHTPVRALGINRLGHYPLQDGALGRIKESVVRTEVWQEDAPNAELASLTLRVPRDDPDDLGFTGVTIEPSIRIPNGLFVAINDHHQFESDGGAAQASAALRTLESKWDSGLAQHDIWTRFALRAGE